MRSSLSSSFSFSFKPYHSPALSPTLVQDNEEKEEGREEVREEVEGRGGCPARPRSLNCGPGHARTTRVLRFRRQVGTIHYSHKYNYKGFIVV